MRLMHFIHTPRHSGAERLVVDLCRIHKSWGHHCAVASFAPPQREFLPEVQFLQQQGVQIFFPERPLVKVQRIWHFRKAIRAFHPHCIFGHSELPSLYGRIAAKLGERRYPFVSVMHHAQRISFHKEPLRSAEHLTSFLLDAIVSVSMEEMKNYIKIFGYRRPLEVIPNGVDISRFSDVDRDGVRRKLGLSNESRVVMQIGRIYELKRQHFTLSALAPLLKKGDVYLWFVGPIEDRTYYRHLLDYIGKYQLKHLVRFLGARSDVPVLLAAADLFIMPSRSEGHSVVFLEALASGIPVVASNIPAFSLAREMPGVALCDLDDLEGWKEAVQRMLGMSRVSRNLTEFSIERTAEAYLTIAERVQKW